MTVRPITVEDMSFWSRRGEKVRIVSMRGDHIGAENIEVLRSDRGPGPFQHCWRVPFVIEGDSNTYWFTMFSDGFPAVAAVVQGAAEEDEETVLELMRATSERTRDDPPDLSGELEMLRSGGLGPDRNR